MFLGNLASFLCCLIKMGLESFFSVEFIILFLESLGTGMCYLNLLAPV